MICRETPTRIPVIRLTSALIPKYRFKLETIESALDREESDRKCSFLLNDASSRIMNATVIKIIRELLSMVPKPEKTFPYAKLIGQIAVKL